MNLKEKSKLELQITIVDDWKKYYLESNQGKALEIQNESDCCKDSLAKGENNKKSAGGFFHQQLTLLIRVEETIRENIQLFIEGLEEEGMLIPGDFVFKLLIKNDRWFIAEKNSQIVFEVDH